MSKVGATHEEGRVSVLGEDNPGVRRVGSDRMAAMDALADGRRETVAQESGVDIPATPPRKGSDPDNPGDDEGYVDPDRADGERAEREAAAAEAKRRKEEAEAQIRTQAGDDDRIVLDGDLSRYVIKAKVDGEVQEIPLERARTELQKGIAADRRLEEATRARREATEEAQRIKDAAAQELAAAKQAGSKAAIERAKAADDEARERLQDVQEKLKEAGDALFAGDADTFARTMVDFVHGTRPGATPDVDVDQITERVTAKVEQKAALKKFATTYPEVVESDELSAMADKKLHELVGKGKSFDEALTGAGEYVRGEIKALATRLGMKEAGNNSTGRDHRQSRKSEIDEPSQARSAQAGNEPPQQPQTASNVIAEMREQRLPRPRPGGR